MLGLGNVPEATFEKKKAKKANSQCPHKYVPTELCSESSSTMAEQSASY
jgi:hypothetical protein